MPRIIEYHIDNPGKVIKEEREKRNMSQQELADRVGLSKEMVSRMEKHNHGLSSIPTRRAIAKALGISPLVLGVGSLDDVKVETLYSASILRKTLNLHRDAYYTNGNFGMPAITAMVSEIDDILKEKDDPKDVLEIYAEYNTLGILIGKEEMNLVETTQCIENALDAARSLDNSVLLSHALSAASSAMYEFDNKAKAERYALEAAAIRKVPNHLNALIQTNIAVATESTAPIKIAKKLVRHPNDYPGIKLDESYCMLSNGRALVDAKQYDEALEELINAEEETPENLTRRHTIIQTHQAQCYLATKQYNDAELVAETALKRAQAINSKPNIVRLQRVIRALKKQTQ